MPLDQEEVENEYGERVKSAEGEMSFLDHLEELRWHVIRSIIAIMIFTIGAFIIAPWVFENIIFAPAKASFPTFQWLCKLGQMFGSEGLCVQEIPFKVQSRYMTGQFTMHIMASLILGLIIAFPYVAWELWRFIKPGLHVKERRYSRGVVGAISFLFLLGILFGFYVMAPLMIYFLATYQISSFVVNEFDITSYVSTMVAMIFGSGMLFQLPVVIYFLSKFGIVTPSFLRKYRKHSVVVILIVAAIVTPPDPLSQTLIAIPLYLLFEVSILISARVERNRLRDEAEERLREEQQSAS
jgi:sec-independent protein translocase protein TatC